MRTVQTLLFAAVGFLLGSFVGGWVSQVMFGDMGNPSKGFAISTIGVPIGGIVGIALGFICARHLVHARVP
jgi:hypothetical protein